MTYHRLTPHFSLGLAALSLLASLPACSNADDPPAKPPHMGNLVGTFGVELIPSLAGSQAYTKFLGVLFDGPQPDTSQLKRDLQQNGCELFVVNVPFCSPACEVSTAACTADNVCTPFPTPQSVGTVHVTGLGPSEVVLEASAPKFVYQPSVTLVDASCAEGAAVGVKADSFSVEGKCVAPLNLLGANPTPVMTGKGVALTWTPPGQSGISRIQIKLEVAHHGGKKGEIHCDVPDSGSFEIPEPLVTKLVSLGLAGFPTVVVARVSSASPATQTDVKLTITSSIERSVDTGVVSCSSDDTQCPVGQTCQDDFTCK